MDPRELVQQLFLKNRAVEERQAAEDATRADLQRLGDDRQKQAEMAFQDVVVPYLEEVQREMGTAFAFDVLKSSLTPIGVTFSLHGCKVSIISRFGHLSTTIQGMKQPSQFKTSVVSPAGLTRETFGRLIADVIEATCSFFCYP